MYLIDKPYISDFLTATIKENNYPIVATKAAKEENERLAFLEHVKFINFYFYFLKLKNMKKWMKIIF